MRVAIYARVSTPEQAEKMLSLPDQFRQLRNWCNNRGYHVVREYEEPGLTATDDRRPVFLEMIAAAKSKPKPFDMIVTLTTSRFFRDATRARIYKHRLKKCGVKVVAMHQEVSDDPMGEFTEGMFELIDQLESDMNGFHTLRAMKENALQGFFNGSRVPYGYALEELDKKGRNGNKKRLVISPSESEIVRKVFQLYLERNLGMKGVTAHLNEREVLRRGKPWSVSTVSQLLANRIYVGEYYFNRYEMVEVEDEQEVASTRRRRGETSSRLVKMEKPESEWVKVPVPVIISEEIFELARKKRNQRSPDVVRGPRLLSSPLLLTGVLKCGECGSALTIATGKEYRYYKCTRKIKQHKDACPSKAVPMDRFDHIILEALASRVFTPERVEGMLMELKRRLADNGTEEGIKKLTQQLEAVQARIENLVNAIEMGVSVPDDTLKERMNDLNRQKKEVTEKIIAYQRSPHAFVDTIDKEEIKRFCGLMRERLLDRKSGFSKEYLQLVVDKIVLKGNEAVIHGNYRSLVGAVKFAAEKTESTNPHGVSGFSKVWLPVVDVIRTFCSNNHINRDQFQNIAHYNKNATILD